jgi:hypothetical protein
MDVPSADMPAPACGICERCEGPIVRAFVAALEEQDAAQRGKLHAQWEPFLVPVPAKYLSSVLDIARSPTHAGRGWILTAARGGILVNRDPDDEEAAQTASTGKARKVKKPASWKAQICGNPECAAEPKSTPFDQCARCMAVAYCSRECQKKYWRAEHRNVCGTIRVCGNPECTAEPARAPLDKCSRCMAVAYCSRECQKKHWRAEHREGCVSTVAKL